MSRLVSPVNAAASSVNNAGSANNGVANNAGDPPIAADAAPANPSPDDGFSDLYICPITQEPPVHGVTFLRQSGQVFERTALCRLIATPGTGLSFRNVYHPTTQETVRRDLALAQVNEISPAIQDIITEERRCRGLTLEETPND